MDCEIALQLVQQHHIVLWGHDYCNLLMLDTGNRQDETMKAEEVWFLVQVNDWDVSLIPDKIDTCFLYSCPETSSCSSGAHGAGTFDIVRSNGPLVLS